MRALKKQQGGGIIKFLLLIIILGFLIYLAWIIIPPYVGNYSLSATLSTLSTKKVIDPNATVETNTTNVINYVARQLRVNDVSNVPLESIKVYRRSTSEYEVDVNYEVRRHVLGNLDVVMTFENQVKV